MGWMEVAATRFGRAVTAIEQFAWRERSRREAVVIFGAAFAAFAVLELTGFSHQVATSMRAQAVVSTTC